MTRILLGVLLCAACGASQPTSPAPSRPKPAGPPEGACIRSGCSGEVCDDHSVISPCIYRPEYDCYRTATCERQENGACGWTQTPELTACLANPPSVRTGSR